jgi:hypothetical protein
VVSPVIFDAKCQEVDNNHGKQDLYNYVLMGVRNADKKMFDTVFHYRQSLFPVTLYNLVMIGEYKHDCNYLLVLCQR